MIILSVHNHYQQPGGEDRSTALEVAMLRARGQKVLEYRESNDRIEHMSRLHVAARTVWSRESYHAIRDLIREGRPDIVHVQNFFPLVSPSVFHAARDEDVPTVLSVRNFRLVCANGLFLRNNRVCEDCMGRSGPLPGVLHGCYRGSRAASAVVGTMLVTHRIAHTWDLVDTFIALSEFTRSKLVESGFAEERIVVKPNFVDPDPGHVREGPGRYALFIGRLSEEKGVRTLVEAWSGVQDLPLRIVGGGPLEPSLRELARTRGSDGRIEFLGQRSPEEVTELLRHARMLVFPSVWYETFGRVAVEAFAAGVPVIASRMGSMAEIVTDGVTGLLFNPGDPDDLAAKVRWAAGHPIEWTRFGDRARQRFESVYSADRNYEMLMSIYRETIQRRHGRVTVRPGRELAWT